MMMTISSSIATKMSNTDYSADDYKMRKVALIALLALLTGCNQKPPWPDLTPSERALAMRLEKLPITKAIKKTNTRVIYTNCHPDDYGFKNTESLLAIRGSITGLILCINRQDGFYDALSSLEMHGIELAQHCLHGYPPGTIFTHESNVEDAKSDGYYQQIHQKITDVYSEESYEAKFEALLLLRSMEPSDIVELIEDVCRYSDSLLLEKRIGIIQN